MVISTSTTATTGILKAWTTTYSAPQQQQQQKKTVVTQPKPTMDKLVADSLKGFNIHHWGIRFDEADDGWEKARRLCNKGWVAHTICNYSPEEYKAIRAYVNAPELQGYVHKGRIETCEEHDRLIGAYYDVSAYYVFKYRKHLDGLIEICDSFPQRDKIMRVSSLSRDVKRGFKNAQAIFVESSRGYFVCYNFAMMGTDNDMLVFLEHGLPILNPYVR